MIRFHHRRQREATIAGHEGPLIMPGPRPPELKVLDVKLPAEWPAIRVKRVDEPTPLGLSDASL